MLHLVWLQKPPQETIFLSMKRIHERPWRGYPVYHIVAKRGLKETNILRTLGTYKAFHTQSLPKVKTLPNIKHYVRGPLIHEEPHNKLQLDFDAVKALLAEGAVPSKPVAQLLSYAGLLPPLPMLPRKQVPGFDEEGRMADYREWERLAKLAAEAAPPKDSSKPEDSAAAPAPPSAAVAAEKPGSSEDLAWLWNPEFQEKCERMRKAKGKAARRKALAEAAAVRN
eukprot:RCo045342